MVNGERKRKREREIGARTRLSLEWFHVLYDAFIMQYNNGGQLKTKQTRIAY